MRLELGKAGHDGHWAAYLDAVLDSRSWGAAIGGGRGHGRSAGWARRLLHGRRRGRILLGSELLASLLGWRLLQTLPNLPQYAVLMKVSSRIILKLLHF